MKTTALLLSVISIVVTITIYGLLVRLIEETNNNIPQYVCKFNGKVVQIKGNEITCRNGDHEYKVIL